MTKGEQKEMAWTQEQLTAATRLYNELAGYIKTKHPEIFDKYTDHKLMIAIYGEDFKQD